METPPVIRSGVNLLGLTTAWALERSLTVSSWLCGGGAGIASLGHHPATANAGPPGYREQALVVAMDLPRKPADGNADPDSQTQR